MATVEAHTVLIVYPELSQAVLLFVCVGGGEESIVLS